MSESELNAFVDELPLHLSPEALKGRLRDLVRLYVHRPSPRLAHEVVLCSGVLALHPALRVAPEEINIFCRLNRHWRLLAALCPAAAD